MDQCCDLLFNDTVADETNANYEYYSGDFNHYSDYMDYKDDLRHEIRQNFTKTECQLSQLHQPADSLSITPFDPASAAHLVFVWLKMLAGFRSLLFQQQQVFAH